METIESDASVSYQKGYKTGYANGVLLALKVGKELERLFRKRSHLERIVKSCVEITPSAKDGEIFDKLEIIRGLARRAELTTILASFPVTKR
ncbi:hypothetical protein M513_11784 [Trichuris suis]|uniref:Uncharacterized protein n=1 Tax=Trichuris suis TaxID=68888 RepID=A0A085LQT0_9BILA|nr:hypothetical protein M513_11784 [Trichuris suis]